MATYNFDPAHTAATFSARHMMIATVRGVIKNAKGTLELDKDNPENSSLEVTLDASTIFTDLKDRDNHLKSADFLDVENHPHILFKSTKVNVTGDETAKVTGDLTIRDKTLPVTLDVVYQGEEKSLYGDTRIGFVGETKINREDWGLTWNMSLESGGWLVGKEVTIHVDVEAVLAESAAAAG
jgi:polyisoprenoid-binding protein YceI